MSPARAFFGLAAFALRGRYKPRRNPADPRILVIRRNRLGDMIYTLPLLHALRRHYPQAHLTVACDPVGAPIAQACESVDEVIVLQPGWNRWQAVVKNAVRLQGYDWIIAAKGGFDRRLALLTRLTNGALRIGFERRADHRSTYYTDPVALPDKPNEEHQIETLLRLLRPLGLTHPTAFTVNLTLRVPESTRQFATKILAQPPFDSSPRFMLINLSSTVSLKFSENDFAALTARIVAANDLSVGLVAAPADQPRAHALALRIASNRVIAIATPGPLELAALLERATFLLTPEGGAAHLAAAVGTPALVLWSEGPFKKWHSRGPNHAFVHAERKEQALPMERVWQALQPYLIFPARSLRF